MYLEYYGLKENPFNITSDPCFFFLSNSHKEALSHLEYGVKEKKGFITLTGEIGAGKTTLCKVFLNQLKSTAKTALVLNSTLSGLQLLEAIIYDFGLKPLRRNRYNLLDTLNQFLLEQRKKDYNVVLIIDEAQNLKISALEEIRLLSNLETDKEKLLQIILVGQPQLKEKLNSPSLIQLRQRIAVFYHINALEEYEINSYIRHRLKIAGSDTEIIFKDNAIQKIYNYTGGIPRLINLVCDRALLLGLVLETKIINADIVKRSISELQGEKVKLEV